MDERPILKRDVPKLLLPTHIHDILSLFSLQVVRLVTQLPGNMEGVKRDAIELRKELETVSITVCVELQHTHTHTYTHLCCICIHVIDTGQ